MATGVSVQLEDGGGHGFDRFESVLVGEEDGFLLVGADADGAGIEAEGELALCGVVLCVAGIGEGWCDQGSECGGGELAAEGSTGHGLDDA